MAETVQDVLEVEGETDDWGEIHHEDEWVGRWFPSADSTTLMTSCEEAPEMVEVKSLDQPIFESDSLSSTMDILPLIDSGASRAVCGRERLTKWAGKDAVITKSYRRAR